MSFELNQGQTDGRVRFLARGKGYSLFLTRDGAVLALRKVAPGRVPASRAKAGAGEMELNQIELNQIELKLLGGAAGVEVKGEEELAGKSNYFIGQDPGKWRTGVPTYGRVRCAGAYPGVDVVYHGGQGELEYDVEVGAGAEAKQVRFGVEGAERIRVKENGDLALETKGGEVVLRRPEGYQGEGVERRRVEVGYALKGKNEFGFKVGSYRKDERLIIDPFLNYSTYLGGTGGDVAYAVGVDSAGDAYVAGFTDSTNFPTSNAQQGSSGGNGDAFISKFNPTGTALIFSTYFGGSGSDSVAGLAVDKSGDVFLTGTTTSSDFPVSPKSTSTSTTHAFQTVYGGNGDAFVTELGGTGILVYSSYLGGSGADFGQAIAVDSTGNAYVTGSTQSPDFPTLAPLQPTIAGSSDVFVTKVNFAGTALVYSTYLGGSQADTGQGIAVDGSGNAYVTGYTFSTDFPTKIPVQGSNAGDADVFVTELNPAGAALVFSTYLGGSGRDRAFGLALDSSANIYLAGDTQSSNFPTTAGVFQTTYAGNGDAFVSKLNAGGTSLGYSSFLGGSGVDQGNGIAVDSMGNAAIVGFTQSSDFPTVNPLQTLLNGGGGGSSCGSSPCADAFVAKLNSSGGQATYSTFLGGSGADFGQAIALDSSGDPFVAGSTSSSNFPAVAGAFQGALGGVAGNAFVAMIKPTDAPAITLSPAKLNFGNETVSVRSSAMTVTVTDAGTSALQITSIIAPTTDFTETDTCVGTIAARGGSCTISVSFTPAGLGAVTDQFTISDNAAGSPHKLTVTGTGVTQATAVTVAPTSLTFPSLSVGAVSAAQVVTITNTGVATLNITNIAVSGDFSETNTCLGGGLNGVLNVGQSCSVSVVFAPTATGGRAGSLSISDTATGSPQSVALSGTGLAVFSMTSAQPTVSIPLGSTTATFMVSASAPSSFAGSITLSCATGVTCTFNPTSIFVGQNSTVTVENLSASTPNPFNFTVNGTSGSQTASVNLTLQFQTFTLSGSPSLDTILAGSPANYTVLVTPVNGFNQQVQLACRGIPVGSTCVFSPGTVTPNGTSPSSVALKITTTQGSTASLWWQGTSRPPRQLILALLGVLWVLAGVLVLMAWLARSRRPARRSGWLALASTRAVVFGLVLSALLALASCRSINTSITPTPPGDYIITITGTLTSNNGVSVTTTVDLIVTGRPTT